MRTQFTYINLHTFEVSCLQYDSVAVTMVTVRIPSRVICAINCKLSSIDSTCMYSISVVFIPLKLFALIAGRNKCLP